MEDKKIERETQQCLDCTPNTKKTFDKVRKTALEEFAEQLKDAFKVEIFWKELETVCRIVDESLKEFLKMRQVNTNCWSCKYNGWDGRCLKDGTCEHTPFETAVSSTTTISDCGILNDAKLPDEIELNGIKYRIVK